VRTAFPQVAGERQGPRDAFLQLCPLTHGREAVAVGKVELATGPLQAMGLPGGRGSPIERHDRD